MREKKRYECESEGETEEEEDEEGKTEKVEEADEQYQMVYIFHGSFSISSKIKEWGVHRRLDLSLRILTNIEDPILPLSRSFMSLSPFNLSN
jgi:hypothetical protein